MGVMVCEPGSVFDYDLLLKPYGRSSPSQTSPTAANLTLLLTLCGSASSGLANRQMKQKTDFMALSSMHTESRFIG